MMATALSLDGVEWKDRIWSALIWLLSLSSSCLLLKSDPQESGRSAHAEIDCLIEGVFMTNRDDGDDDIKDAERVTSRRKGCAVNAAAGLDGAMLDGAETDPRNARPTIVGNLRGIMVLLWVGRRGMC